jgi:hypothetical protein
MTRGHGAEGPGPGAFEGRPAPGPGRGETAPGLRGRETPQKGDRHTLPIDVGRGSKIVFVDFGGNKVYALEDDGDEVMVFDDFADMVERLKPSVVVADAYPRKLLPIHPLAREIHRENRRLVEKLAEEIHKEALKLPLYRLVFEQLGLKGAALAYLVSHDGWALRTLPRDKLILRFQMTGRRKHRKRSTRSRLLIMLARSTVLNKHNRYYKVYRRYFERFEAEVSDSSKKAHWKAILRVAERILRDLHGLAKNTKQTTDT